MFDGVVVHHIEQQAFRGAGVSRNILFDAEESEAGYVLGRYSDLLAAAKHFGWPAA